jgi:hypothetical protein
VYVGYWKGFPFEEYLIMSITDVILYPSIIIAIVGVILAVREYIALCRVLPMKFISVPPTPPHGHQPRPLQVHAPLVPWIEHLCGVHGEQVLCEEDFTRENIDRLRSILPKKLITEERQVPKEGQGQGGL